MPAPSAGLDQATRSSGDRPNRLARTRTGFVLVAELLLCAGMAVYFFMTFFGFTGGMLDDDYTAFDVASSQEIYQLREPWLTVLMRGASFLGAELSLVLLVVIGVSLVIRKHRREAVLLVVATLIGFAISFVVKDAVGRPRPELSPLIEEGLFSYPSGHSINAFIFYLLLAYLAFFFMRSKLAAIGIGVLCIAVVLATGFSRVYLGVHYPTDVMAGYIVGFWLLLATIIVHRLLLFRDRLRRAGGRESTSVS